ncbi:hypothetical protein [Paractinoplanes durhamensis]|uniref:hypothetical protein n=1 Tax=Paractinoplanes durhamensis TaxID=113563 RepID=UPI0036320EA4
MDLTASTIAKPPRQWEAQTFALLIAIAVAAGLGLLLLVTDLATRSARTSAEALLIENGLYITLSFGYTLGFLWWQRRTREVLRIAGDPNGRAADHWTVLAWYFALAGSVMVGYLLRADAFGDPAVELLWTAGRTAIRVTGFVFLLLAVGQVRNQVREQVARSGVIFRIPDLAARRSPLPPAILPTPRSGRPWTCRRPTTTSGRGWPPWAAESRCWRPPTRWPGAG